MSNNDFFNDMTNNLQRWYHSEIRSIADSAIEACAGRVSTSGERAALDAEALGDPDLAAAIRHGEWSRERDEGVDPREFMIEYVDQTTDDHEFVIYTFKAGCVLLASSNDGAYEQELGDSGKATVEARACMAMRADVWELLEARSDAWETEEEEDVVHLEDTGGS